MAQFRGLVSGYCRLPHPSPLPSPARPLWKPHRIYSAPLHDSTSRSAHFLHLYLLPPVNLPGGCLSVQPQQNYRFLREVFPRYPRPNRNVRLSCFQVSLTFNFCGIIILSLKGLFYIFSGSLSFSIAFLQRFALCSECRIWSVK